MKTLILLFLVLLCDTSLDAAIYVRPCNIPDSLHGVWPWSHADSLGINHAVDANPDFDEIRVLPGSYWERVDIGELSSSRTSDQIITGYIPGILPDSGHVASGDDASRIKIRSAIRPIQLEDIGDSTFQFDLGRALDAVRVFSDTLAWTRRQGTDTWLEKSYYLSQDQTQIFLRFDLANNNPADIAILASNAPDSCAYALLVDLGPNQLANNLTVSNLTLQYGLWGASSFRYSSFWHDTFENVTFMDSYYSEFRFNQSQVDTLFFQDCQFVKHAIPGRETRDQHVTIDAVSQPGIDYDFHNVHFDSCQFRATSDLPPTSLYAFQKERSTTRIVDMDGLTFQDCSFNGPYTSAIYIRPDRREHAQDCLNHARNFTFSGCHFEGCSKAIHLLPQMENVLIDDNDFINCKNGLQFEYSLYDSLHEVGCFTDHVQLSRNRFNQIGIYNAQTLADSVHWLAHDSLRTVETYTSDIVSRIKKHVDKTIGEQGYGIRLAGHMQDLRINDNIFNQIGKRAIEVVNANGGEELDRSAVRVTGNIISNCLSSCMRLNSSWMTVQKNQIHGTGTSNELYKSIDRFYLHLSDLLFYFENDSIKEFGNLESMVSVGLTITPPYIKGFSDAREITILDNTFIGCKAQGVLTEGTSVWHIPERLHHDYYRVRDIDILNNIIWTKPYVVVDSVLNRNSGAWSVSHLASKWPTLWISDTDHCRVLGNQARCDDQTDWEQETGIWTAGIGIAIDGCDSVRVEGNHFHGLSEAFRLRVDNQNGNTDAPNSTRNLNCVLRENAFTGLKRDSTMGSFLFSHQSTPLLAMGYLEKFEHLPPRVDGVVAFQGNVVEDNLIQIAATPGDDLTWEGVPSTLLNYPLSAWPESPDSVFFTGHNCVDQEDNPDDLGSNVLRGNYFNLIDLAEENDRSMAGLQRRVHIVEDGACKADALTRFDYSLRRDGDYPNDAIRLDNSWNCAFDSVGVAAVPELGDFPLLAPVLRVPEDFATLQEAVDFAATHPRFLPRIRVSSAVLEGPGNAGLQVPAGRFIIEALDSTLLNAAGAHRWISLAPGAELQLRRFTLQDAAPNDAALSVHQATLVLADCRLLGADSLDLEDAVCVLQGSSRWEQVRAMLRGAPRLYSEARMDWRDVSLRGPGQPDPDADPLLEIVTDNHVTLCGVVVTEAAGAGLLISGAIAGLDSCLVQGCGGIGLWLQGGETQLHACHVDSCGGTGLLAMLGARPTDVGGRYQGNQTGMEWIGSTVMGKLLGTTLEANQAMGLFASSCDVVTLDSVTVRQNGGTGVFLQNADARLERCRITGNGGRGLSADHSRVDMSEFAGNVLQDNASTQLVLDAAEPWLLCGHNTIAGQGQCLVDGASPTDSLWSFQFNYWGAEGPVGRICLSPANWQLYPVCDDICLIGSECIAASVPRSLLQQAAEWETLHEWLTARNTYQTIPEPWPTSEEALSALHGVYRCTLGGKLNLEAARIYFTYIVGRFPGTALAKVAEDLAIRCKGAGGERMAAAGDFLSLSTATPEDSLANLRKAVVLATEAVLLGEMDKGGGTDALSGLPAFADMQALTAWLQDPASSALELVEALPADFALGAPWPNPFNPIVHFELALPEAARVTLRIHNLLGQRVRQLEQAALPAGRHLRRWDGTDEGGRAVASGVYLLSVEARGESGRSWSKAEKLLLVR